MPTYFPYLFFHLELVWGGIDRNVPCKATADPAGLRSLRPSRPLVQYKGLVHALLMPAGTVARCALYWP